MAGMNGGRRWDREEDEILYDLHTSKTDKKTIKEIAVILRRSEHSVEARWRWLHVSDEERRKRREREYARRRLVGMKIRGKSENCGRVDSVIRIYPEHVFVDRAAREAAPRSLTSLICGDPPPGWSALDRRRE